MSPDLKARIYGILEPGGEDSRYFDPFILGLIVLNVAAVVLETVESIYNSYALLFNAFEIFSVAVFSLEYILRVWSCTENPRFRNPVRGRLRFMAYANGSGRSSGGAAILSALCRVGFEVHAGHAPLPALPGAEAGPLL